MTTGDRAPARAVTGARARQPGASPSWARLAVALSALLWVGAAACGEGFSSGGTGGGGASTGTASGTGSPSGTAAGTASGTNTNTANTTSTGPGLGCPADPCTAGAALQFPCSEPCLRDVCDVDAECCSGEWTSACVAAALRTCGMARCAEACELLYGALDGYLECDPESQDACLFVTTEQSSCATICGAQGADCTPASSTACGGTYAALGCDVMNDAAYPMVCSCLKICGAEELPCPPGQICYQGGCS